MKVVGSRKEVMKELMESEESEMETASGQRVRMEEQSADVWLLEDEDQIQLARKMLWAEKVRLQEENAQLLKEREQLFGEQEMLRLEKERFQEEVQEMQKEMARQNQSLLDMQKKLKKDELFFQQKMEILKGGFAQLAADRKELERERILLDGKRDELQRQGNVSSESIQLFFSGVRNPLTLKKRYRDLIKIFHPDNLCGDTKLLQQINRTYETLLEETGWQKKA